MRENDGVTVTASYVYTVTPQTRRAFRGDRSAQIRAA